MNCCFNVQKYDLKIVYINQHLRTSRKIVPIATRNTEAVAVFLLKYTDTRAQVRNQLIRTLRTEVTAVYVVRPVSLHHTENLNQQVAFAAKQDLVPTSLSPHFNSVTMTGFYHKPRLTLGRLIPNDLRIKIKNIFLRYKEIPLMQVPVIYHWVYDEILDGGALGFETGLLGLFEQLEDLVKMTVSAEGKRICTLTEQSKPKLTASRSSMYSSRALNDITIELYVKGVHDRRREKNLFDENDQALWQRCPYNIRAMLDYDLDCVIISQSPLELALERNPTRMSFEKSNLHKFMKKYPQGIYLNEIYSLYPLDKRLFNSTTYAALIEEYPEIFYLARPKNENEEPLIYDGLTHTYPVLYNPNLKNLGSKSSLLAYQSIVSGLYQKTLLLLRKAGKEGLKLSVWRQSIKSNFVEFQFDSERQDELLSLEPLVLFLNLASIGIIELRSHRKCKNDIRIHFPTKNINFEKLLDELESTIFRKAGLSN